MNFAPQIIDQGAELARKCELKEKLYSALRSKPEINDLSEKLLTKYLEQEKELQQLFSYFIRKKNIQKKNIIALQIKDQGAGKNLVDEPRSYSK
ncbi:36614_t:CDS:1, partial [Gigaspora margarita]